MYTLVSNIDQVDAEGAPLQSIEELPPPRSSSLNSHRSETLCHSVAARISVLLLFPLCLFVLSYMRLCDLRSAGSVSQKMSCLVEEGVGYWWVDAAGERWYRSLPTECQLYPILWDILRTGTPNEILHSATWYGLEQSQTRWLPAPFTHSTSSKPLHRCIDGRYMLWLSDSVDRIPISALCTESAWQDDIQGVYGWSKYGPLISPQHGMEACHVSSINLTLVHAMTFGVEFMNTFFRTLIPSVIPAHIQNLTRQLNLSHFGLRNSVKHNDTESQLTLHPCATDPVPDVLVVHSCLWDAGNSYLHQQSPDELTFGRWIKSFEVGMLIPALIKYSNSYRSWQRAYISAEIERARVRNVSMTVSQVRFDRFETVSDLSMDLCPSPVSHPLNHRPPPTPSQLSVHCAGEPLIVLRTCPPLRDGSEDFQNRTVALSRINRAIHVIGRHYRLKLLDMSAMFDGWQNIPGFMDDWVHYTGRTWLHSLNVLLNMYQQHLVEQGHDQCLTKTHSSDEVS